MRFVRVLPLLGQVALFLGCQSQEPAQAPMQLASGSVTDPTDGAARLAAARCLSAQNCSELDPSMSLGNYEACMNRMRSEAARELSFCHKGIDSAGVQGCADTWMKGDCQGAFAPITAFPACHTERICTQ